MAGMSDKATVEKSAGTVIFETVAPSEKMTSAPATVLWFERVWVGTLEGLFELFSWCNGLLGVVVSVCAEALFVPTGWLNEHLYPLEQALRKKKVQTGLDLLSATGTSTKSWTCLQLCPYLQVPRWKNTHGWGFSIALGTNDRASGFGDGNVEAARAGLGCSNRHISPCEHRPCWKKRQTTMFLNPMLW
jgi:hypothetical protein